MLSILIFISSISIDLIWYIKQLGFIYIFLCFGKTSQPLNEKCICFVLITACVATFYRQSQFAVTL